MYRFLGIILAVAVLGSPVRAHAQETIAALGLAIDHIKAAMNDVIGSAGAQGRSVVLEATGALDGAMEELKQLVHNDLSLQVASLTGAAQMIAQRIKNTTME